MTTIAFDGEILAADSLQVSGVGINTNINKILIIKNSLSDNIQLLGGVGKTIYLVVRISL